MSRLANINLKLKDGRSILVTVDEDKVDRFRNGPDKLLDALAKKYPHDLPTKPVYISVQDNNITNLSLSEAPDITLTDAHNPQMITCKERRVQLGSFHWERNDVLTLIRLRSEKEPMFNKFGVRKKDVWAMIAEEFQAKGFDVTSGQCEQKWKNITKNYRDTVDYSYFSNNHRECPFFKELAAVYPYDPKEKHSNQQSGINMSQLSGGMGAKTNTTGATVGNSDEFSNYHGIDTTSSSSGRPTENLNEDFQQETYLQEVTPDISVDALFQTPAVKQEIIDDDDDPVIVIPTSPPPPPPPPLTMASTSVASLLSSNRDSPIFQPRSLPQLTPTSSITLDCNIPSISSILLSPLPSSSLAAPIVQSSVKQEPISVPMQYSSSAPNVCLQPQISEMLQTQQISSGPQTSFTPVQSLSSHSSTQSNQHSSPPMNPGTQTRKRPRENLSFTSSSNNSVSDMLAYRRRLLRRTPFSVPNNMLEMLKQMNEERRREHRTLMNTLNQHHEDLLDLFKQHQQEYLHQEEIKQALLSELIERMSKN